ncbi:hypothetical protein [Methanococcoides burtonii]|uniref:hypothetical protein n=1 Tax=Methanococcoides burtonii TaxID=29291 RepID=UPI00003992AD|nr:hypothetical protein [Methanococcoides burtonii]
MDEERMRSLKGEWKCVHSQNEWCTFDRMTENGHICLSGKPCNGYEDGDSCSFKETVEDLR